MSSADWILLLIVAAMAINGLWQGLARQVANLLGLVAGLAAAAALHRPLARGLASLLGPAPILLPLAWVALLLACWIGANLIGLAARRRADGDRDDWGDALGGALLGLASGVVLAAALVAGTVALGAPLARPLASSRLGGWLLEMLSALSSLHTR